MAAVTTLDMVLNTTLTRSRKKLMFAAIKSNAFMAWAFAQNRVEFEDGGHEITNPLLVGRNPNVTSYEYFDELPMTQTNELTTVKYGWSRVAGSVIVSDQEQDENMGEAAIVKLIDAKMKSLDESIREKFGVYLYGTGVGTDPFGLGNAIPDDPTTGTFGGISRATNTYWRTSVYNFAGALDSTNIEEAFDDVMMDLSMKGNKLDLMLCGRNIIRTYRQAVRDKAVINLDATKSGKAMYDLGFSGTTHQGVTMLYDEDCPVDKCYFINSTHLKLHVLKHVNMKLKNLIAPWNVDATGKRIVWQGQLCLWKAYRTHALLNNET